MALLQTLLGPENLRSEVTVPRVAHAIDALIRVDVPTDLWGPLGPVVARRTVVLEHESRPPFRRKLYTALAKLTWVVQQQWKLLEAEAGRYPLLLFLSAGCPRWVSSGELGFREGEHSGAYQMRWSLPADVVFINLRGLPESAGFSLLKLMPTPRNDAEVEAGIERLKRDPGVLQSTKDVVLEAIMNQQIPATDKERWLSAEALRQEGRRDAILKLAQRLADADELRSLETLDDLDELERRVHALLDGR